MLSFIMTPLVKKCVSIKCPCDSEVLSIILKSIKTKSHKPISGQYFLSMPLENIEKSLVEASSFLTFSGSIEKEYWSEMG